MPTWTPTNIQNLDDEIVSTKEETNQLYQDRKIGKTGMKLSRDVGLNLKSSQLNLNNKELPGESTKVENNEGQINNVICHKQEQIDRINSCGIPSGRDGYLDSKNTLGTCQSQNPFVVINNLPVFLDESFFKLHPKEENKKFNNSSGRKQEAIDIMQSCGQQSGKYGYLDSKNTLETCQSKNPFVVSDDPTVFPNESLFKLHPEEVKKEEKFNSSIFKQKTIDMIQSCSVQSGRDGYLHSKNTLGTCQSKEPFVVIDGLPVFLEESFFKLQPKKQPSSIDYFTPSSIDYFRPSSPTPSTSTITSTSTLSSTLNED